MSSLDSRVWIGVAVAVAAVVVGALAMRLAKKDNTKKLSRRQASNEASVVSGVFYYPVKSCHGIATEEAHVGRYGFEHDRQRVIMNAETNRFVTQRQLPQIALIHTEVTRDGELSHLTLTAPGMQPLQIPLSGFADDSAGKRVEVGVWSDNCEGYDEGDAAATWLQTFLQKPNLRLVRMPEDHNRQVEEQFKSKSESKDAVVSYADAFPFLLISEGSLAELNRRIGGDTPLKMNRFRPNIVVKGEPFVEDTWKKIKIGNVVFDVVKPCTRCKLTTVDQEKGEFGLEPLNTLKMFRKGFFKPEKDAVCFGQNLLHVNQGTVPVGATVEVLEYHDDA